jgi:tetratricopeptide (TPR) repeat protein
MLPRLILLTVLALAPASAYNQGNRLYARKDYAAAAESYRKALEPGPGAAACYNLGNALFKSGHVGRAIVQYRRAYHIAPRDGDVRANLAFARGYRADKTLAVPGPLAQALDDAFHLLSAREAGLLAAVAFLLAALALALWILRRRPALAAAAIALAGVSLFGLVTQRVWDAEVAAHPAVVVVPEVDVLAGPEPDSRQILLVHDGTEVQVRERRGAYLLVQLPGGNGGWLPAEAAERIY